MDEHKVLEKVVRKLRKPLATDEEMAVLCRAPLEVEFDFVAAEHDRLQATIDLGMDCARKARAQKGLDRVVAIRESARQDVLKQAKGIRRAGKTRSIWKLAKWLPAPNGDEPWKRREYKKLGIWTNHSGPPEEFLGRWWVEDTTTGERMGILLCVFPDLEVDAFPGLGAGQFSIFSEELDAGIRSPDSGVWFAAIRSPIYGSLDSFLTRGQRADLGYRWFRWTRRSYRPEVAFTSDVQGVDATYGEGASDQTVSLDFGIDWSVKDPQFRDGECGRMTVYFEFQVETGSGYEWMVSDRVHEAKTIPFTTAEGRFEGRAEFTGDSLWTQKPTRMRLRIGYELEDVCQSTYAVTESVPLTNSE